MSGFIWRGIVTYDVSNFFLTTIYSHSMMNTWKKNPEKQCAEYKQDIFNLKKLGLVKENFAKQ